MGDKNPKDKMRRDKDKHKRQDVQVLNKQVNSNEKVNANGK